MNPLGPAITPQALAQCPYLRAHPPQPAPAPATDSVQVGGRPQADLAPNHEWLASIGAHTPVPMVPLTAWENAKHYDVVVAGAGMGGLFTAWRLKNLDGSGTGSTPNIGIFERTHHIGGRARTTKVDGAGTPLDLGAMRFIPSQHVLVNALAEHFKLPTHEFVVGGDKNLQYFRGERHTNEEVAHDPSVLPFHLAPSEKGKSADDLLAMAIEAVVPNFRSMGPAEWEAAQRNTTVKVSDPLTGAAQDVPLYQLGLQNVLARTLSREAINMVTDSVGYQSFLQNWDAGQALQALAGDFKPGTVYRTPDNGMASFPKSLRDDLRKIGTEVQSEKTLRRVDYDQATKKFHLTFADSKGNAVPVVSDQLVLNLPKLPLATVVADSPFLQNTPLEANLGKVTQNPMSRIFLTFDKAWWKDSGIQSGRSLTDLPLGQVYYYGKDGDTRPYVQVYADGTNSEYWEGLQNPADPGVTTTLSGSPQLAAELQHELTELHGQAVPAPNGILYKRWADPFFGGAYHTWNAGSKPFESADAMVAPLNGVPLYVCGEAFSTTQGWIEGALQTSEKVLAKMGKAPLKT